MNVLISKLALFFIYPIGVFTVLVLLAILCWIFDKRGAGRILVGLGVVVILFSSSPIIANWLASRLESQFPPVAVSSLAESEVLVSLGGALAPPVAPRIQVELQGSSDRLLHAARVFKQGKTRRIYLTGGNVFPGYGVLGESHYAKLVLEGWGVPGNNIEIDDRSRTTYENAIETRNYLSEKGWINKPIILVTSALHMPRAVETFRAANIRVIAASTDVQVTGRTGPAVFQWLPSAAALQLTTVAWHEMVGLWYYRLRGWALAE